ncbi:chitin-binding protein CbpD [Pseudomonas aeruginosa]|uniref:chitin-binding protein CbpD n=1 Tax=Pseudomonas aeruginosa TaxID=287 RepID=UPI00155EB423|nr:chitin-binding protein CbpD [Pseudomonas aeruginosa]MBH3968866.1 chitin-binding protein CbpD [Pseudomonas aeruginosa]NRC13921.1 chitin-binding protein CbpD [Pseudomonas aeruginosa]
MKHYSATLALLPLTLALFLPQAAHAHGSMETPPSRVYGCFLEGPENPKSAACKAAVAAGGTQALYDWNGVNQGNANGNHQAVVPDGQLCGAGKALFKGLNLARSDWPSTAIAPDASGNFQFVYKASAPHATRYFDFYITKDGYNPEKPLAWSDLEPAPFCSITSVKLENGTYRMNCPLPQGKTGKHVIYNVWQRSDSPEAFYACIDVSFSGAVANPWQALGNLRAQQDLPAGATVTLRLFDAQGRDAQRHSLTLAQGANGAKQWPLALAQKVNQDSTLVNIGVLDAYGAVSPVASSQDNQVYVRQAGYRFQIDIELPVEGGGEQPGGDGKVDFDYPQGLQQYDAGTVVRGADGKRHQCKPYPNSGWCKGWDLYYAPGKGMAWQDAWTLL